MKTAMLSSNHHVSPCAAQYASEYASEYAVPALSEVSLDGLSKEAAGKIRRDFAGCQIRVISIGEGRWIIRDSLGEVYDREARRFVSPERSIGLGEDATSRTNFPMEEAMVLAATIWEEYATGRLFWWSLREKTIRAKPKKERTKAESTLLRHCQDLITMTVAAGFKFQSHILPDRDFARRLALEIEKKAYIGLSATAAIICCSVGDFGRAAWVDRRVLRLYQVAMELSKISGELGFARSDIEKIIQEGRVPLEAVTISLASYVYSYPEEAGWRANVMAAATEWLDYHDHPGTVGETKRP